MAVQVSLKKVSLSFQSSGKTLQVLNDVNFDVEEKEFVSIVGPSGCGKSTLLNSIVGLRQPTSGEVLVGGERIRGITAKVGYVTQNDNLVPWRTLLSNVELALELRGVPPNERRSRSMQWIERVGLSGFEKHYPNELSGGMRKRVTFIRTMVYDPEVVLMDEPFGALDAQTRVLLGDYLLRIWEDTRKTIIFVTHDLIEAIALSDRVIVMSARPTTVKLIRRIDLPRPRSISGTISSPELGKIYQELWTSLKDEVQKTILEQEGKAFAV